MRPRRVVLLVNPNEQSAGVRKYLLEIKGFRVLHAADLNQAVEQCASAELVLADGSEVVEIVCALKAVRPDLPTLVIGGDLEQWLSAADVCLPKFSSPAEIVERVRMMLARKRGPKKRTKFVPAMTKAELDRSAA